jgi:hypothetical protein
VLCPLCGARRARRGCPALGQQICAVCCGTKRLVQIQCPSDCTWLASAREHPPAVIVRQQQRDIGLFAQFMRDFSERQSQIFFLVITFLARYQPSELQPLIDDDVAEGMAALASTFETASRGVIYEHRPASLQAERLIAAMKPALAEAARGAGTAFERDAAVVLRRIQEAVGEVHSLDVQNRRALLDLLKRIVTTMPSGDDAGPDGAAGDPPSATRLIVP